MEPFRDGVIVQKFPAVPCYTSRNSPQGLCRYLPSLVFYTRLLTGPLLWLCRRASKGLCDDATWVYGSAAFADMLERLGFTLIIEGLDGLKTCTGPTVFLANHMSTMETFLLPSLIRPFLPVTFVVKDSLVRMPFFGPVMRSRDPIVLERRNPREDLQCVLNRGCELLAKGISIIIFPQSTRMTTFDPHRFNTIGEKLARKAGVPVLPIAIKTDAWQIGSVIKDAGRILPGIPVHVRFGRPEPVTGTGREQHAQIIRFIQDSLSEWRSESPASATQNPL